jgi:hypothetical protein
MTILPVSISKISYFDELDATSQIDTSSEKKLVIKHLSISNEIINFLNNLDIKENYIATIEFTPEFPEYRMDIPKMVLSKPIMINKFSSPTVISMFILERLHLMIDCYYLDDEIINLSEYGPDIKLKCNKFYC